MISLRQDAGADTIKLNSTARKLGAVELKLSNDIMEADIAKLQGIKQEQGGELSKVMKGNIAKAINYIKMVQSKSKQEDKFTWAVDGGELYSTPFELVELTQLGINAVDYVELTAEKMIAVGYAELANIIAFELMFRDLGENHESMEDKLGSIGLTAIHPSSAITGLIDSKAFEMSKVLKIGDSAYLNKDTREIHSYFYKDIRAKGYREVVKSSCLEAINIIVSTLIPQMITQGMQVKLYSVSETGFYMSVPEGQDISILKSLDYTVTVRTFGRRFEVLPNIRVY